LLHNLGQFTLFATEIPVVTLARVTRLQAQSLADDSHTIYVAETVAGEIVGYGAVHRLPYLVLAGPEGYVSELLVRASERGQGVGRQLLQMMETDGRRRGCSRLMLLRVFSSLELSPAA
jgi:GNAT superfamily N-acetyltransferase